MDSRFRLLEMPSAARVLLLPALFSLATSLPWPVPERLRRDDVESTICGWRQADFTKPASCSSGTQCVYDTLHQVVGCCPDSGPCTTGIYTSCVDKNSGSATSSGPNILTCTGTSVCYQDSYPGGYRRYGCGAYGDAASVATTYVGQQTPTNLHVAYTALSLATAGPTSSGPTSSRSTSVAPTSVGTASVTASPPSSPVQVVTVVATSTAPAVTATASAEAAISHTNQATAGIIVGGVVGGLSFTIGILAVACFLLSRRRRKSNPEIGSERIMRDLTSESNSVEVIKDTSSVSSFASSNLSDLTQVHPLSPDDVGGSQVSFAQSTKLERVPTPPLQSHPAMQAEAGGMVSPETAISLVDVPLDDLAGLPAPWIRPPTPPPRSPKRMQRQSEQSQQTDRPGNDEQLQQTTAVEKMVQVEEADFPQSESLAPLQIYLASPITTLPRSQSILSSDSVNSRYSRTTDGRSIAEGSRTEGSRARDIGARDSWQAHKLPPMPIIRKPVGGWYRTPSTTPKSGGHKHIGYHMVDGATLERDIMTALPQTRQRSASGPAPTSESQVGNTQGLTRYISEGRRRVHGDLAVAPLTLNTPTASEVPKKGHSSLVPILSVPAAPSAGEREKRLYDI